MKSRHNKVETLGTGTGNRAWNWKPKNTKESWSVSHISLDDAHCLLPHRPHVIVRLRLPAGAMHSGISSRSHWPFIVGQQLGVLCSLPHWPLTHTQTDILHVRGLGSPNLCPSAISPKTNFLKRTDDRMQQVSSNMDGTQLSKSVPGWIEVTADILFCFVFSREVYTDASCLPKKPLDESCFFCFLVLFFLQTWQLTSVREVWQRKNSNKKGSY